LRCSQACQAGYKLERTYHGHGCCGARLFSYRNALHNGRIHDVLLATILALSGRSHGRFALRISIHVVPDSRNAGSRLKIRAMSQLIWVWMHKPQHFADDFCRVFSAMPDAIALIVRVNLSQLMLGEWYFGQYGALRLPSQAYQAHTDNGDECIHLPAVDRQMALCPKHGISDRSNSPTGLAGTKV
jgi:hypothetical protein